ncbi:Kri1-like C-terminal domain-containing protein [Entamoeba marina]
MAAVVADEKKQQKQKIQQKLLDLNKVAGMNFDDNVLDEEFDPVKFDQMMNNKFNDDYYMEQDDNVEDLRKELAMEMKTDLNDMEGDDEGDNNMEEDNDFGEDINENNGMEMVDDNEVGIERKKNKDSVVIEQDGKREHVDLEDIRGKDDELDQMIEDYYKLDYEDVVDGKKTRFEYVDCKKDDSGLTALDILQLDNKQLNKIISLKKLQPYDNRDLSRGERIKIKKAMDVLLQSNKKPRHSKSSNHPRPQHSHSKAQMKFKQNKQKLLAKKQQIQKKSSK